MANIRSQFLLTANMRSCFHRGRSERAFAVEQGRVARLSSGSAGGGVRTMAIAPVLDTEAGDWPEDGAGVPVGNRLGNRHALALVPGAGAREGPQDGSHGGGSRPRAVAILEPGVVLENRVASRGSRRGADVTQRSARRVAALRRRRAVVLAGVAGGLVCGLALPFAALGGSPAVPALASAAALRASAEARGGSAAAPAAIAAARGEAIYVVQPGDTLWSIASRFDHGGDPRPLAEALARETGSAVVVPGERIAIP